VREEGEALGATVAFDALAASDLPVLVSAWDEAAAKGSLSAALRHLTQAYRHAPIEAQDASSEGQARRAPHTALEFVQDPVRMASVTFTAGFVWWLTRSGGLLTTMLLGVPAWRHVDLLPVLARPVDDDDDDKDNDADGDGDDSNRPTRLDVEDSALVELFGAQAGRSPVSAT
jgi:hypothetical protein